MTLVLACLAAFVAAVIQRITGLGFVLVLVGPIVLLYGPLEGVTIGVLLALVASLTAIPLVWKHIEWRRAWWLIWPGLIAAPFAALLVRVLPEPALLLLIAAMAYFALLAGRMPALSASLTGRTGAVVAGSAAGFMHVASGLSGPRSPRTPSATAGPSGASLPASRSSSPRSASSPSRSAGFRRPPSPTCGCWSPPRREASRSARS
nr:hypothetical protein GCM10025699_19010 [Microbacterium flavescens]